MKITININTKSASFNDSRQEECENLSRIFLEAILTQKNKTLIDINGNTIGRMVISITN